jgi:hypothetical protein
MVGVLPFEGAAAHDDAQIRVARERAALRARWPSAHDASAHFCGKPKDGDFFVRPTRPSTS